jgi:hypothetical protein
MALRSFSSRVLSPLLVYVSFISFFVFFVILPAAFLFSLFLFLIIDLSSWLILVSLSLYISLTPSRFLIDFLSWIYLVLIFPSSNFIQFQLCYFLSLSFPPSLSNSLSLSLSPSIVLVLTFARAFSLALSTPLSLPVLPISFVHYVPYCQCIVMTCGSAKPPPLCDRFLLIKVSVFFIYIIFSGQSHEDRVL